MRMGTGAFLLTSCAATELNILGGDNSTKTKLQFVPAGPVEKP